MSKEEAAQPLGPNRQAVTPPPTDVRITNPMLDGVVIPAMLMLLAADLLIRDPSRQLAWRLLHAMGPTPPPPWLFAVLPARATFDRDPLALLLAGLALALAGSYLGACLLGAPTRIRAGIIALGVGATVLFPTFLYVSVGAVTGRPFGQDGGVVQLPLAMDRLLVGQTPYGADYSDSVLGSESRASAFWRAYGENPIVRHHAYLPGTHLLTLPFYLGIRALTGGFFDTRIVSTLAMLLAILMAVRLFEDPKERLLAAALIGLNPLVYWHQAFGANDIVFVALLLASARAGQVRRLGWAGALLGLACATKQLAWPFAPFLVVHWASIGSVRELALKETWARLTRPILAGLSVFAAVVLPAALLDPHAFWSDIVSYNAGLSADAYPLGGTPGFGIGNFVIYLGRVQSLRDAFPFQYFYLLLIPLGLLMVHAQVRRGGLGVALAAGSVSLLATVYFSRVAHANYLIAVATLLPIGVMLDGGSADGALTPLALLNLSTLFSGGGFLQSAWESASAADLPSKGSTLIRALSPRASSALASDPLGLALAAIAAALALVYAAMTVVGTTPRVRGALVLLAIAFVVVIPTTVVARIGVRTGVTLAADDWVVRTRISAAGLAAGESPYAATVDRGTPARDAWSASFNRKPPQPIEARTAPFPPGSALLGLLASAVGFLDARVVLLGALGVALGACGLLVAPAERPLAWTVLGLLPPAALGIIFGAGQLPWLAALLITLAAARWGRITVAGIFAGAALAVDPRAIVVVLFAPMLSGKRPRYRPFLLGALCAYGVVVGPVALLDPRAMAEAIGRGTELGSGMGVINIAAYAGLEASPSLHGLLALSPWLAGSLAILLLIRGPGIAPASIAALWLMVTLSLARGANGFDLSPPITFLALSATTLSRKPIEG
jgi:hypothetical protein